MKYFALILLYTVVAVGSGKAQFTETHNYTYNSGIYDIFILKLDSSIGNGCKIVSNHDSLPEAKFFDRIGLTNYFAITASIVDSSCSPLGLFVTGDTVFKKINLINKGFGNFYNILPNGIFYVTDKNEIGIKVSAEFDTSSKYRCAIQTGPILVNKGVVNTGLTKNSINKFIRCGIGIYKDKDGRHLVFAKSNSPVNYYDFASLFLNAFKCDMALTLESGIHCSLHFPSAKIKYSDKIICCKYLLFKL